MKTQLLFFSVLGCLLLTVFSCKKKVNHDPLPPATQTGANTMGCYVNGKAWLPDTRDNGSIPRLKAVNAKFWNTNDQLLFTFYRQRNPDDQDITIFIKDFIGIGIYSMNQTSKIIGVPGSNGTINNYLSFVDDNSKKQYVTNENYTGITTITYYNAIDQTVSGTFQFKGQNTDGSSDSILVTQGRFDCKL